MSFPGREMYASWLIWRDDHAMENYRPDSGIQQQWPSLIRRDTDFGLEF